MRRNQWAQLFIAACVWCVGASSHANVIGWNTWSSDSSGTMTVGGNSVAVTFSSGNPHHFLPNSPSWTPHSTWADGAVVGNAPTSSNGLMQLFGGPTEGIDTLSFSTPVVNPVVAIWSLGNNGTAASFVFDQTPTLVAGGPSAEFAGSSINISGNTVWGYEANGTVEFMGTYASISWTNPIYEDYYGFNVGAPSIATPVPGNLALLFIGLVSIGGSRWLFRRRQTQVAAV